MTTEEAWVWIQSIKPTGLYGDCHSAAVRHLKAELARVTAERDRLMEAWPATGNGNVINKCADPGWRVIAHRGGLHRYMEGDHGLMWFATRTAAVRAAAGLDPEPQHGGK